MHFFILKKKHKCILYETKWKHLANNVRAPPNEVSKQSNQPKGRVSVTFDLQLCSVHIPPRSVFVSTRDPSVILYLNETDKKHVVLIMHYDFIFSFYYHFRGTGGMFIVKQFTYFCMR